MRSLDLADRLASWFVRPRNAGALVGIVLRVVTAVSYHEAVLDSTLDYVLDFIERNRKSILDAIGKGLRAGPTVCERLASTLEAVTVAALPWRTEPVRLSGEVVRRWKPRASSDRIELAVGVDLQFSRGDERDDRRRAALHAFAAGRQHHPLKGETDGGNG